MAGRPALLGKRGNVQRLPNTRVANLILEPLYNAMSIATADREWSDPALVRLLVERIHDYAVFAFDQQGLILSWSRPAERLLGYSEQEVLGQSFERFYTRDDVAKGVPARELQHLLTAEPVEEDRCYVAKNGSRLWCAGVTTPLFGADGSLRGFAKVLRDTTERQDIEQALREREQQLAAEADALSRLNAVSSQLWRSEGLDEGLKAILDATLELLNSDMGSIQLLHDDCLSIAVHRGFGPDLLGSFRALCAEGDCACWPVLRSGTHLVIEDVETDARFAPLRPIARAAGYRALVSTPIPPGAGKPLGVISAYFRAPHRPSEHELRRLDLCARQAGDYISRCRNEAALRASKERFRALVEASSDVIYCMSPDWTELRHLIGRDFVVDTDEPSPSWLAKYIPPEDQQEVRQAVAAAICSKCVLELEHRVLRKDGSLGWTFSRAIPLLDEAGAITEWYGTASDITARKVAESERERLLWQTRFERDRLWALLTSIPEEVWYTDLQGRFTLANPSARKEFQLPGDDEIDVEALVARLEVLRPDGSPRPVEEAPPLRALKGESVVDEEEIIRTPATGELRHRQVSATPVRDSAGQIIGAVTVVRDISSYKRLERSLKELTHSLEARVAERTAEVQRQADQLRALASELSQAEQRERKRLAEILHDHIQQLIVAAQMQIGALKREIRPEQREAIEQRVDSILEEALDVSRSLAVELSPPVLREAGLIEALHWLASRLQEQHDFTVHLRLASAAEPATDSIKYLLFESVRELLLNAIKHASTGEAEVVLMRASDTEIRLVVRDSGQGFDPDRIKRRRHDDNSFGLFSIQQRLAHWGGRMDLDSAPGRGTQVTLFATSPRVEPLAHGAGVGTAVAEPTAIRLHHRLEPCRVLIVDDHPIIREGLVHLLDFETDIEVVGQAGDGPEAIALAESLTPDVVLMDVNLGEMDGIEATRRILARQAEIKVIGLSMHIDQSVADAMRDAGTVAYLTKGGRPEELIAAIRACCARDRAPRAADVAEACV